MLLVLSLELCGPVICCYLNSYLCEDFKMKQSVVRSHSCSYSVLLGSKHFATVSLLFDSMLSWWPCDWVIVKYHMCCCSGAHTESSAKFRVVCRETPSPGFVIYGDVTVSLIIEYNLEILIVLFWLEHLPLLLILLLPKINF